MLEISACRTKRTGMVSKFFAIIVLATLAGACTTIESRPHLSQPTNQILSASTGGVIVRIDRSRNLENAFGGADVFGRRTYEGFSELRFMGTQNGMVAARRVDVAVQNDETTMSRSGTYIPGNTSALTMGTIGSTPFSAITTVSGPGTYIPPRPANISVSAPSVIDFLVPVGRPIPFEGVTITFRSADTYSLTYSIQN